MGGREGERERERERELHTRTHKQVGSDFDMILISHEFYTGKNVVQGNDYSRQGWRYHEEYSSVDIQFVLYMFDLM